MDRTAPRVSAVLVLLAASAPVDAQPAATDFQLTPQSGQDDVQQWFDRYEYESRAKEQDSAPDQKQASGAYRDAMVACLTHHGYAVRYAPPQPPPIALAAPYVWSGVQHAARKGCVKSLATSFRAGGVINRIDAASSSPFSVSSTLDRTTSSTWFLSCAINF
jgi:hypothetical protein